jgi:hypothetical protein
MITEESQAGRAETAFPAERIQTEPIQTGQQPDQKGFRAFLRVFLKALRARKKQVSSQQTIKTAQDWRDEAQARNPWWGNGF